MSEALDQRQSLEDGEAHISLLLDLMSEINRGAGMEAVFSLIGDALRRFFGIDRFAVSLVGEGPIPHVVAAEGLSQDYVDAINSAEESTPGIRAMQARRPVVFQDAPSDPSFAPFQAAAQREGFRTVLFFPLYSGDEPLGFLVTYHDGVRTYTQAELALAQVLATQAGVAMAQARQLRDVESRRTELEQRFTRRSAEAEATDKITLRIASSLDLQGTIQSIVDAAAELTGAATASLYLKSDFDDFRAVAAYGTDLQSLSDVVLTRDTGLLSLMCRTGKPAQVVDFPKDVTNASELGRSYARGLGVQGTLGVPLLQDGDCIGALYVARAGSEPFPEDSVRMLSRLASFAQVALRNAERFSSVQEQQRRLQGYVDAIPESVIIFDRSGKVILTNEAFRRELRLQDTLSGTPRELLLDEKGPLSSAGLQFRFDRDAVFERVLSTGEPEQGLVEVGDPARMYEVHYGALRRTDASIDGVVATMRDITTPLELERERAHSHLLSQLLELSAHLNSDLSSSSLIERVVESAMQLVGASAGTLGVVAGDSLIFRRYRLPDAWTDYTMVLERGQGAAGRVWATSRPFISNDAKHDPIVIQSYRERFGFTRLAFVPVIDRAAKVIGCLGVYDPKVDRDFGQPDIEALQLLSHQAAIAIENARLNELKDEFLSVVSHELKTPVTSIKGFTQILQRHVLGDAEETTRRYLDVINHQADRLTALINDLLDLSRIRTGHFVFQTENFDYGQLVSDVVEESRLLSPSSNISLYGAEHVELNGNPARLQQVLVNLIDNSVQHGPPGGEIQVSLSQADGSVITVVHDDGPGLPPGEEQRVFAQYYQVRHGTEQQVRGLGLGLFISKQIVEEHGGKIWLDRSRPTSFCFSLPLSAAA
jgi:GAF domain-containing protein